MLALTNAESAQLCCPLSDLVKWTGAAYLSKLRFIDEKTQNWVKKKVQKWPLSTQQKWFGVYFQKEITNPPFDHLELRWISREMGWGLFAKRELKKMAFIATYAGVVRKRKRIDKKNSYCFEYLISAEKGSPLLIDAREEGSLGRYINHSVRGNLSTAVATLDGVSHIVIYAKRAISAGEELRYDYGPDYWESRPAPNGE